MEEGCSIPLSAKPLSRHWYLYKWHVISSKNATLKLNREKCEPSQTKAIHLGHSTSAEGISDDGKKTKATQTCWGPQELRWGRSPPGPIYPCRAFAPALAVSLANGEDGSEQLAEIRMHQQCPGQGTGSGSRLCSRDLLGFAWYRSPRTGHPCAAHSSLAAGEKCPVHKLSQACWKQLPCELDRSFSSAATLVIAGIEYGLSQPREPGF